MSSSVEGFLDWDGYRTWYRVVGEPGTAPAKLPVVICHGGPGGGSDACEPMVDLSEDGRLCVLYDQLGCGRSQHLPSAAKSFWTMELFKRELDALLRHLAIADRYVVLGQSCGGMLAMEHGLEHPGGLRVS